MPAAPELPVSLDSLSLSSCCAMRTSSNPRLNPFLINCAMSSGFVFSTLACDGEFVVYETGSRFIARRRIAHGKRIQSNFHTAKLISDKFSSCSIRTWLICMWWWFTLLGKLNLAFHQHTISCDIPPEWFMVSLLMDIYFALSFAAVSIEGENAFRVYCFAL